MKKMIYSAIVSCSFFLTLAQLHADENVPVYSSSAPPQAHKEVIEKIQTAKTDKELAQANTLAKKLVENASSEVLISVIYGIENANPVAENILRGTAGSICDKLKSKANVLSQSVSSFIPAKNLRPQVRSFAFELLQVLNPEEADKFIPSFIEDPSDELRRFAVEDLLSQGSKLNLDEDKAKALTLYNKALSAATDDDQVKAISAKLQKLGVKVDIQKHFGYLNTWDMIGPFNNREMAGFKVAYPPESTIKLEEALPGQLGEVKWKSYKTEDNYGKMDIAKQLGPFKGAITYAHTTFSSDKDQDIEFRLSTPNAWKLWVNGELLFAREEYHRGTLFDQYKIPGKLKKGNNTILLKVCQNEQTQDWAQDWVFQFRICDITGHAVQPAK